MSESTSKAKKKADELIEKFNKITGDDFDILKRVSKQCAILCVKEQIKLLLRLEQLGLITLAEYNLFKEQFEETKYELYKL